MILTLVVVPLEAVYVLLFDGKRSCDPATAVGLVARGDERNQPFGEVALESDGAETDQVHAVRQLDPSPPCRKSERLSDLWFDRQDELFRLEPAIG